MGVSRALARNARTVFEFSAARFGQARAITNARHEATRMSRQRVEREDVRLFLDGLDEQLESADEAGTGTAVAAELPPQRRDHA